MNTVELYCMKMVEADIQAVLFEPYKYTGFQGKNEAVQRYGGTLSIFK